MEIYLTKFVGYRKKQCLEGNVEHQIHVLEKKKEPKSIIKTLPQETTKRKANFNSKLLRTFKPGP